MSALTTQPLRGAWALLAATLPVVGAACGGGDESAASAAASASALPLGLASTGKAIFVIEPSKTGNQVALRETILQAVTPQLVVDARVERLVVSLPADADATNPAVASAVEVYEDAADLRRSSKHSWASVKS